MSENKIIQMLEKDYDIHIGTVLDYLNYEGRFTDWSPGDDFITLDDRFSFEELEALVLAARKQGYLSNE